MPESALDEARRAIARALRIEAQIAGDMAGDATEDPRFTEAWLLMVRRAETEALLHSAEAALEKLADRTDYLNRRCKRIAPIVPDSIEA